MENKIYPFDDCEMIYDYKKHRYLLTESYVKQELNIQLSGCLNASGTANSADVVNLFLNKTSALVYNFIYKHTQNKKYVEFMLAKCPELRCVIRDAMLQQVEYFRNNGDIGEESGVNLKDGRAMKPEELRGIMRISPDTYDILNDAGLFYTGQIVLPFWFVYPEDY